MSNHKTKKVNILIKVANTKSIEMFAMKSHNNKL